MLCKERIQYAYIYIGIFIYVHSRLKPFSIRPKAVFKQHNPYSNHEIHVPFEHGFWLKSVDVIGQCKVTPLCPAKTDWPTLKKLHSLRRCYTLLAL